MEIKMTKIPGGKKGTVGKISVKIGETVEPGAVLAQVETAKGNKQVKAAEAGSIVEIFHEEGQEVASEETMFIMQADVAAQDTEVSPVLDEETAKTGNAAEEVKADVLIIGGGPGGYVAAINGAKRGLKVILVEKDSLGGTCLNRGCIPTKALVKSSEICHNVKHAELFGIEGETSPIVNMKKVIARKNDVVDKLVSGVEYLMEKNSIQVIKGHARFISETLVAVSGEKDYTIDAKDIIIATGSKCSKVNIPGIDLPFVMNSTTALEYDELPKSITIIGGGVIGMEFAFIYRNFGVEVHVIEFMDRLLTMVDEEVSEEIKNIAIEAGIDVCTGAKVTNIQNSTDGKAVVTYECNQGSKLVVSEKVIVAIGREPNIEGLDVEKAGVKFNENGRGIQVDGHMRTNVEHIYAIGDVNNIMQLAHVASHQGIVAIDNILGEDKSMDYTAVPNVIFTEPEIASVGLTEDVCKAQSIDYKLGRFDFMGNGKALTMEQTKGFIKLIKDKETNKIIGGTIIGAEASSLISAVTVAIANGLTDENIRETIFAHPTTAEVIHEAAYGLGIGVLHQ